MPKKIALSARRGVNLFMVQTLAYPQPSTGLGLPAEFTLQLGPHSSAQLAAMARILKDLGAQVAIDADGSLVAHRPND